MKVKYWILLAISIYSITNALTLVNEKKLSTIIPHLQAEHKTLNIPEISFFSTMFNKWNQISSSSELGLLNSHESSIFSGEELDFLAYTFCKKISNVHFVMIWPRAKHHEKYIIDELRNCGEVIYTKDINVRGRAIPYILQAIPEKAKSIPEHLQYYFDNKPFGSLTVVLCTFSNLETAVKCKLKIRQRLNLNPPITALHVADTHQQSIDLARIFFNDNTLWYLNHDFSFNRFEKYKFLINKYKNALQRFPFDSDYCCVDGSAILAMHGIRDVNVDFDFLTYVPNVPASNETFSFNGATLGPLDVHNDAWVKAGVDPIETIFNPQHHFYYQGIKYASIKRIRHFKFRQNRPVDQTDVQKIDKLIG